MKPHFENIHAYIDLLLSQTLQEGDTVIDATLGNGHDTLKLAKQIGTNGTLYGFDIQEQAIANAKHRLATLVKTPTIHLFHAGHETMREHVPEQADVIVFNLGYLPGGNKDKTTKTETTLQAIDAAVSLLKPSGMLFVAVYPGHEEGARELEALTNWGKTLSQEIAVVTHIRFSNQKRQPPQLFIIQKSAGGES